MDSSFSAPLIKLVYVLTITACLGLLIGGCTLIHLAGTSAAIMFIGAILLMIGAVLAIAIFIATVAYRQLS